MAEGWGKVATASILKLAATAAADERENPEAEPEPEKPPTECEVMVEKVRQLIYGDKPEEKPELIDPDNPSPRDSEEEMRTRRERQTKPSAAASDWCGCC